LTIDKGNGRQNRKGGDDVIFDLRLSIDLWLKTVLISVNPCLRELYLKKQSQSTRSAYCVISVAIWNFCQWSKRLPRPFGPRNDYRIYISLWLCGYSKKQSQFVPDIINISNYILRSYVNSTAGWADENKPNSKPSPAITFRTYSELA
jgi:hypothetical protein